MLVVMVVMGGMEGGKEGGGAMLLHIQFHICKDRSAAPHRTNRLCHPSPC